MGAFKTRCFTYPERPVPLNRSWKEGKTHLLDLFWCATFFEPFAKEQVFFKFTLIPNTNSSHICRLIVPQNSSLLHSACDAMSPSLKWIIPVWQQESPQSVDRIRGLASIEPTLRGALPIYTSLICQNWSAELLEEANAEVFELYYFWLSKCIAIMQ